MSYTPVFKCHLAGIDPMTTSEYQHTQAGFGLTDYDKVTLPGGGQAGIAQMQVNQMCKELGIDPSNIAPHGLELPFNQNAPTPSSPVQAYRSNGVLYHNLEGNVWSDKSIQRRWTGWP
ncbi:MAG: hypothetical protein PHU25_08775 [Deltaproteobacteria bacterium]|nr:hypothetical protein [Deltaproteobacteria bacterium]